MNIRLEQLNVTIGDIKGNVQLIKRALYRANDDDIDLLVVPELAVCGYSPMDLLERPDFLDAIYRANDELVQSSKETALLFGTVTPNDTGHGRKCFNSALLIQNGETVAKIHKTLLPTYDVYDELRYFEPARSFECIKFKGVKIGITICEDLWHNFKLPYISYDVNPAENLVQLGARAIFNVSASPYTREKPGNRQEMLQKNALKLEVPIFYANQVGGNSALVSDGDSMVVDRRGKVVARAPLFDEAFVDVEWSPKDDSVNALKPGSTNIPKKIEQMFWALVTGLRDYLRKTGVAEKVVVGLSGGIDSALVATIATQALRPENVVAITMPSEFSTPGSITDSKKLAQNLGIELQKLAIKDIYDQFKETLDPLFRDMSFGVAEENLQPRIRSTLLMAYSNRFDFLLLNTGNKSELAVGYCTLYGDMAGGLGIITDLYKTEIYDMAHWLNNEYFQEEIIPKDILAKPPSAELRPDQKDTDTLPDYDTLDGILKAYIEEQLSIKEITAFGYNPALVEQITTLVDQMEYKRFQSVPGLKVSDKAFGSGRRWPLVQKWS
ncbi:MAG TPA: NAD+ synthase [Balneolaceae bacterium]|nr:NAD+ synthase [Balneolaceae bacterium]